MAKIIPNETVVEVKSKDSWENGNWGVVRHFDGDHYHVAMNNGEIKLVFSRRELVVKPSLQSLAGKLR